MTVSQGRGKDVLAIAGEVSEALGEVLNVSSARPIGTPVGKAELEDASLAFYVDGKRRTDDIVLLLSSPQHPGTVAEDAALARSVASRTSPDVAQHIAVPLYEGSRQGRAFAAFSRLSPLSARRLPLLWQKRMASARVVPWLVDLAGQTRESPAGYERHFMQPLRLLCEDRGLPGEVRRAAGRYLDFAGTFRPDLFTVTQHGDFWIGNILFRRRVWQDFNPSVGDFTVIDWRGARSDGYPCVDLVSFAQSISRPGSLLGRRMVRRYQDGLNLTGAETALYCYLGLGKLAADLDRFPKELFVGLCSRVQDFVAKTVPDADPPAG